MAFMRCALDGRVISPAGGRLKSLERKVPGAPQLSLTLASAAVPGAFGAPSGKWARAGKEQHFLSLFTLCFFFNSASGKAKRMRRVSPSKVGECAQERESGFGGPRSTTTHLNSTETICQGTGNNFPQHKRKRKPKFQGQELCRFYWPKRRNWSPSPPPWAGPAGGNLGRTKGICSSIWGSFRYLLLHPFH